MTTDPLLATTPWFAKPVAFVSYGATSGGIRAIEALRLVMAELHAVGIRATGAGVRQRRLLARS